MYKRQLLPLTKSSTSSTFECTHTGISSPSRPSKFQCGNRCRDGSVDVYKRQVLEWLNPEYTSSVSLQASLQHASLEQAAAEAMRGTPRPRRVRIAAVQYLLRPIACFDDFAKQVEFFVHSAKDYHAHFVLFPEFFTMQLLSYINEPAPACLLYTSYESPALTVELQARPLRIEAKINRCWAI